MRLERVALMRELDVTPLPAAGAPMDVAPVLHAVPTRCDADCLVLPLPVPEPGHFLGATLWLLSGALLALAIGSAVAVARLAAPDASQWSMVALLTALAVLSALGARLSARAPVIDALIASRRLRAFYSWSRKHGWTRVDFDTARPSVRRISQPGPYGAVIHDMLTVEVPGTVDGVLLLGAGLGSAQACAARWAWLRAFMAGEVDPAPLRAQPHSAATLAAWFESQAAVLAGGAPSIARPPGLLKRLLHHAGRALVAVLALPFALEYAFRRRAPHPAWPAELAAACAPVAPAEPKAAVGQEAQGRERGWQLALAASSVMWLALAAALAAALANGAAG